MDLSGPCQLPNARTLYELSSRQRKGHSQRGPGHWHGRGIVQTSVSSAVPLPLTHGARQAREALRVT